MHQNIGTQCFCDVCICLIIVAGSCNGATDTSNDAVEDENAMLDWRIFPTSVKASKDPSDAETESPQFLSRAEREQGAETVDLGAPVSRDQLYRDLLKERRREIHVEDFLWTGSGK